MKPTTILLRPPIGSIAVAPPAPPPIDVLTARKQTVAADVDKLAAATGKTDQFLNDVVTAFRHDTSGRPAQIPNAIAVRVMGASCTDQSPIPLPNLSVTLSGDDKTTASAMTDVTGIAVLPALASNYHLVITASDGTQVAAVPGDPSHTHLVQLGDVKSLEGHAVLGRGWMAALAKVDASRAGVAKAADVRLNTELARAQTRLATITNRIDPTKR